jgi:methylmalonyl-CoA/ethylmalonyl-CoA epimerase
MNYTTDHVGYLTGDIGSTAKEFERLGYVAGDIVDDDTQRTKICFLTKPSEVRIELVQPYEDNKTMQKMLKRGVNPYHTCYVVDDIHAAYEEMLDHDFTPLFKPVAAPAFGNRLIGYFFKQEIGLVELVNRS